MKSENFVLFEELLEISKFSILNRDSKKTSKISKNYTITSVRTICFGDILRVKIEAIQFSYPSGNQYILP